MSLIMGQVIPDQLVFSVLETEKLNLTLSQTTNFRLFQTKGVFTDYNFKIDENDRKLSKWVENTWKRRNCLLRAISPFPTVFSKDLYSRYVKTRACLGKG